MKQRAPRSLWRFSLRIYAAPRVAASCIALQDQLGLDVNLLLFCCWLGTAGQRVPSEALRSATRRVESWQREVVWPLRRARRAIDKKTPALQQLRRRIATIELASERHEQEMLQAYAARLRATRRVSPRSATMSNLKRYFRQMGRELDEHAARHVGILVDACGGNSRLAAARA